MADALPRVRKTICCWPYNGGDDDDDDDDDSWEESNSISSECLLCLQAAAVVVAGINAADDDGDGGDSAASLEPPASSAEPDEDGLEWLASSWSSPSVTALVGRESRVGVTTLMGQKMSNCTHSRPSRRHV